MTPDDCTLVQFLRQHRPTVPPAAIDLEDRVMAALATTDWETDGVPSRVTPIAPALGIHLWRRPSRQWLLAGTVLAVSVLAAWSGQRLWRLAQAPSPAEVAEIEQFMEQSWQGTLVSATTDAYNPFWPEAELE